MREGKTYNSGQLIEMIKEGGAKENEAIRFIWEHNRDTVTRYVQKNSGQETDAEDLIQESLMALREKVKSSDFSQIASLHNYFFGINKNQWLKILRKRKIMLELDAIKQRAVVEDSFGELIRESLTTRDSWLKGEMKKLGKNCLEVLLAKANGQRSEDIAEDLELGGKTVVDATATRCRRKLEMRLFGMLGEKCKQILTEYVPAKRKAKSKGIKDMTEVYESIAEKHTYASIQELINQKNNCLKQLYSILFPDK